MQYLVYGWFQVSAELAEGVITNRYVITPMHPVIRKEVNRIFTRINKRSQLKMVVDINMDTITTSVHRFKQFARKQLQPNQH